MGKIVNSVQEHSTVELSASEDRASLSCHSCKTFQKQPLPFAQEGKTELGKVCLHLYPSLSAAMTF